MMPLNLKGILPPIPSPFNKEKIYYEKLILNIEKWNQTGIIGFVVLGSNGEFVYLSEKEKKEILKTVVRSASKDKLVIVGSGCESTKETIRQTKEYAQLGADAALIITPSFYGNKMNNLALAKHYTMLADASPLPILLYNVPKFTHINLDVEIVSKLSKHPNIIGIKDSSGNVNQLGDYLNNVDENFQILVGTAGALLSALSLGCSGGILALANIAPESCVNIFNLVQQGHLEEAKKLQLKMIPVNKAITTTYGIGGLKTAMDLLGYFGGKPRLPLLTTTKEDKKIIQNILIKAGLL